MSVATRRMATQPVELESHLGRDGQGMPTYSAKARIQARVVREDKVVTKPDGSEVRTTYTLYVDGGQSFLPKYHDRLTVETDGELRTVIVEQRSSRKRAMRDTVDHVRVRCREE